MIANLNYMLSYAILNRCRLDSLLITMCQSKLVDHICKLQALRAVHLFSPRVLCG